MRRRRRIVSVPNTRRNIALARRDYIVGMADTPVPIRWTCHKRTTGATPRVVSWAPVIRAACKERATILRRKTGLGVGGSRGRAKSSCRQAARYQRTGNDPLQGVGGVRGASPFVCHRALTGLASPWQAHMGRFATDPNNGWRPIPNPANA
jgi:hypothetical protein